MMRIDGVQVPAKGTVLESCRAAGADVPAFCEEPRLSAGGHCRACMVEMDGRMVAACTTPAAEGSEVHTQSERVRAYRRDLGELMLHEASPRGWVGERLRAWGATGGRYGVAVPVGRKDHSHATIHFDADHCISCRRCLRACEEIEGAFVFAIEGRGEASHLAWGGIPFSETDCVTCGACVELCPAGALVAGAVH